MNFMVENQTESSDAVLDAEQNYRGYPVEPYLTRKGKTFWRSSKLLGGGRQPHCYETLELLHRFIDERIAAQEFEIKRKGWDVEKPAIEGKISQLLKERSIWDKGEMMTALDLQDEQKFLYIFEGFKNKIYHDNGSVYLRTKEMTALRRAARKEVGTYSSAPIHVIPNSRKKPQLTGEYAESCPIGRNRFKTVRNSSILVTVGENWKPKNNGK